MSVTPAVRRLANSLGVNLHNVAGTGAGGRITTRDVRNAAVMTDEQATRLAQLAGVPKEELLHD